MGSEGEVIPLQDMGIAAQDTVVLRRHRTTATTRRNVAIIDDTLVTSGNEFIHQQTPLNIGENFYDQYAESGPTFQVSGRFMSVRDTEWLKCMHGILLIKLH